ncbi:MAG: SDR family NAD(P)-dependent oxidoreductase [Myxococcota bacterium]
MADKHFALVTGANKGIGKELARILFERGLDVFLGCRNETLGQAAASELDPSGKHVMPVVIDVTRDATIDAAAEHIRTRVGKLDVLVNNAATGGELVTPSATTRQMMRDVYETNVFGPVAVCRAMLGLLRAGDARIVVNVSSELGSLSMHSYSEFKFGAVNVLPYCSSKTALNALTVFLAKELRDEGFKVNSVNPGFTATDLNGHRGTRKPEDAAKVIADYATPGRPLTSGEFVMDFGALPW